MSRSTASLAGSVLASLALGGCFDPTPVDADGSTTDAEEGSSTDATPTSMGDTTVGEDTTDGQDTEPGGVCGDGMVDAGEDCDDAGESATCNADCTAAECGDGVINRMAGEACDDAGPSESCNVDCTSVSCGDGFVGGTEECDEGGKPSDACDPDCTLPACGDGVFNEAAEECDEGDASAACDSDCTAVDCGDGLVNEAAGEICDAGMQNATCDIDCTPAECGDGYPNGLAGEQCDDGGESLFCNGNCTISACGDAVTNAAAGEQCDDAGQSAACDLDCTFAVCGDGVVNDDAGEQCDAPNASLCTYGMSEAVVFSEDFSDNLAGWTLGPEWQIGPAIASPPTGACGNGDPGTDHSPSADNGVAGVVIGGNAGTALHDFYWLTSPVINTSGYGLVELDLWRWLNSDYTRYMQNRIQVWDGAAWQTVWETGGSPGIADAAWTSMSFDITELANANMQIRIGFNIASGGVFTCSQWNVDDIVISASNCE